MLKRFPNGDEGRTHIVKVNVCDSLRLVNCANSVPSNQIPRLRIVTVSKVFRLTPVAVSQLDLVSSKVRQNN